MVLSLKNNKLPRAENYIEQAWNNIPPLWPLQNYIARNPLVGLEDLPIEEALQKGAFYFQQPELPEKLLIVNRETIKWCQVFFDDTALISLPNKDKGLYQAVLPFLIKEYKKTHGNWLSALPDSAQKVYAICLEKLNINNQRSEFISLLLSTLPGWAGYIKYYVQYNLKKTLNISLMDYLALRLLILAIHYPDAIELLNWQQLQKTLITTNSLLNKLEQTELNYQHKILPNLSKKISTAGNKLADAQLIFCIDVRSEPLRRILEQQGNYETFSCAGFFGLPIQIKEYHSGETVLSCPAILQPKHIIKETLKCSPSTYQQAQQRRNFWQQMLKVHHHISNCGSAPFALIEALGLCYGFNLIINNYWPNLAAKIAKFFRLLIQPSLPIVPSLYSNKVDKEHFGIDFKHQIYYAENILRLIGLTENFAPLVVFCGHGASSKNNPYAKALNCGACGGNHGGINAQIIARILNEPKVRQHLANLNIIIPDSTYFLAAEHNTTTDNVTFFTADLTDDRQKLLANLKLDLIKSRQSNNAERALALQLKSKNPLKHIFTRSNDWAETRPEWGLARNAAFIIAPRALSQKFNFQGRVFLHSYDWRQDASGTILEKILVAPMQVTHWINAQYLFGTIDNIAYGSGSKVTQNITSNIAIMQGNVSDLMCGLPLQSLYDEEKHPYHIALRLTTIVYAPPNLVIKIINKHEVIKKLIVNGWKKIIAIDPNSQHNYLLDRELQWQLLNIS